MSFHEAGGNRSASHAATTTKCSTILFIVGMDFLDLPHAAALLVFASYFVAIIGLFALIITSLLKSNGLSGSNGFKISTFIFLTLASFVHTWFCASQSLHVFMGSANVAYLTQICSSTWRLVPLFDLRKHTNLLYSGVSGTTVAPSLSMTPGL